MPITIDFDALKLLSAMNRQIVDGEINNDSPTVIFTNVIKAISTIINDFNIDEVVESKDLSTNPAVNKSIEILIKIFSLQKKIGGLDIKDYEEKCREILSDVKHYSNELNAINESDNREITFISDLMVVRDKLSGLIKSDKGGDLQMLTFVDRYISAINVYINIHDDWQKLLKRAEYRISDRRAMYESDEFIKAFVELFACERISRNSKLNTIVNAVTHNAVGVMLNKTIDCEFKINQRATRIGLPWIGLKTDDSPKSYLDMVDIMNSITNSSLLQISDVQVVNPLVFKDFKVKPEEIDEIMLCYVLAKKIAKIYKELEPSDSKEEAYDLIAEFVKYYDKIKSNIKDNSIGAKGVDDRRDILESIEAANGYIVYANLSSVESHKEISLDLVKEKAELAQEYINYLLFTNKKIPLVQSYEIINQFLKNNIPITPLTKKMLSEYTDFGKSTHSTFDHVSLPMFFANLSKLNVIDIYPEAVCTIVDAKLSAIKENVGSVVSAVNDNNGGVPGYRNFKIELEQGHEIEGDFIVTRPEANILDGDQKQATFKRSDINVQIVISNSALDSESVLDDTQKQLFITLLAQAKENSKDGTVIISNCVGRPKVARALFKVALDAGMQPKYAQDGSDPRGILERRLSPRKRLRRV